MKTIEEKIKELQTELRGQTYNPKKNYTSDEFIKFVQCDILKGDHYSNLVLKYGISQATVYVYRNRLKKDTDLSLIPRSKNKTSNSKKDKSVELDMFNNDLVNELYKKVEDKPLNVAIVEIRRQVEFIFNKRDDNNKCLINKTFSHISDSFKNASSKHYAYNFGAIKSLFVRNNLHNVMICLELCGLYVHTSGTSMDALLSNVNNNFTIEVLKEIDFVLDKFKEE